MLLTATIAIAVAFVVVNSESHKTIESLEAELMRLEITQENMTLIQNYQQELVRFARQGLPTNHPAVLRVEKQIANIETRGFDRNIVSELFGSIRGAR